MTVVAVANPKGGVGKSTLATNLAGYFARQGHAVMLGDVDRQQSSRQWLGLRPPHLPAIQTWEISRDEVARPPKGVSRIVLDTPAGMHGKRLDAALRMADVVLVPMQPSLFDIQATHAFLAELHTHKRAAALRVGVVGMRVREGTLANERLHEFIAGLPYPAVAYLRDTQNYVHLAAHGLTLWDVSASRVERDLQQWQPLLDWMAR